MYDSLIERPLTQSQRHCMQLELTFISVAYAEGVAEHSFLGCNHQSTCMPSHSLYVQLLWYSIYYPGGMKTRMCPVQWLEPHNILVPTQDSNPGGRIQNHKRWPLHYHCTHLSPHLHPLQQCVERGELIYSEVWSGAPASNDLGAFYIKRKLLVRFKFTTVA